jgi:ribosomal protein S18 acetylase RimI-like enzyme
MKEEEKLDNPVWYSLSEEHSNLGVDYGNIKFYHPDYCPFGGFKQIETISASISEYSLLIDNFFVVGEKPGIPSSLKIKNELVCLQMISVHKIDIPITETIVKISNGYMDDLFKLVNRVQPGYFKKKTAQLGNYYGIIKNNELIAVTGERMKMNNYGEVSAVITHPDHTGKGYAKQLVAHTVSNIYHENKIPYLHVAETNKGAIQLYNKLGFETRRKISFWNIIK